MFQSARFQSIVGIVASILLLLIPFQRVIPIELSVLETVAVVTDLTLEKWTFSKSRKSRRIKSMSTKPRRPFTPEQKADFSDRRSVAVRIVTHTPTAERSSTGKPISQIAKEMGLTESALQELAQASPD